MCNLHIIVYLYCFSCRFFTTIHDTSPCILLSCSSSSSTSTGMSTCIPFLSNTQTRLLTAHCVQSVHLNLSLILFLSLTKISNKLVLMPKDIRTKQLTWWSWSYNNMPILQYKSANKFVNETAIDNWIYVREDAPKNNGLFMCTFYLFSVCFIINKSAFQFIHLVDCAN